MEANAAHKLTNGDLDGMDAGQLREHLLAYRLEHGTDDYTDVVIARIAALMDNINEDDEVDMAWLEGELDEELEDALDERDGYEED